MSSIEQMREVLADNEKTPYKQDARSTRAEDDQREFRWRGAWELVSRFYMECSNHDHQRCLKN